MSGLAGIAGGISPMRGPEWGGTLAIHISEPSNQGNWGTVLVLGIFMSLNLRERGNGSDTEGPGMGKIR